MFTLASSGVQSFAPNFSEIPASAKKTPLQRRRRNEPSHVNA